MENYNFFAYLNRMKYIERWSLMRSTVKENIMEHSEQVAQLTHVLAAINNIVFEGDIDIGKAVSYAVFHESSEVITGDLPTPIKYYNADINNAYKHLEQIANEKLVSMLPAELKEVYSEILEQKDERLRAFVKAADKLAAYIKCIEEIKCGNTEFVKAKQTLLNSLNECNMPELDYFLKHFLSGFEKTLDELE